MSGFQASAEALSSKSTQIGEVGASIRECVQASDEMGVGGLVYGVYFDPTMLPALSMSKDRLAEIIGAVADGADQISANLKKNADTYASVETFLEQKIKEIDTGAAGGVGGGQ